MLHHNLILVSPSILAMCPKECCSPGLQGSVLDLEKQLVISMPTPVKVLIRKEYISSAPIRIKAAHEQCWMLAWFSLRDKAYIQMVNNSTGEVIWNLGSCFRLSRLWSAVGTGLFHPCTLICFGSPVFTTLQSLLCSRECRGWGLLYFLTCKIL